jgi:hypothetical protein
VRILEFHFLAAAVVLHLAIPVAAEIAPTPSFVSFFLAKSSLSRLEIEVDVEGLQLPEQADSRTLPIGPPRELAHNDRRSPSDLRLPEVAPEEYSDPSNQPPEDSESVLTTPDPGGADEYGRPPSRSDIDRLPGIPGLNGTQAWQYPGGILPDERGGRAAPTRAPKRQYDPQRATKVLEAGQRAQDSKLGLHFPGGPVIADAIKSAVRASDAPFVSGGQFVVSVNAQGKVTKVQLVGHKGGGSSTWQAIRKSAQAALAGRTLPLKSSFAKGAMVSVVVSSDQKMPGGGTSRQGTTFNFDVTDIDARPVRVVTASWHAQPIK